MNDQAIEYCSYSSRETSQSQNSSTAWCPRFMSLRNFTWRLVWTVFQSSDQSYLNNRHHWLVWSTGNYTNIEYARLRVDSEVTWASPDSSQHGVDLYDLYKINTTWPIIAAPAGHWNRSDGLVYNITRFKYLRRHNLHRLNFDTAIAVRQSKHFMAGLCGFTVRGTRMNPQTYFTEEVWVSFLTSAR
jgi:hypothetical protein